MDLGLKRNEVKLVPFSEEWGKEFQRIKKKIQQHTNLNENRIEHIGSTSIKNMDAKPILDIAVGIDDITDVDKTLMKGLKNAGFLRLKVERPNEIVLAKFKDETYGEKTHFIHMVNYKQELWENLLFFRDYLNTYETAREEYRKLKRQFFKESNGGINDYTDYKEKFVKEVYSKR